MPSGERSARVLVASASDPACGSLRQYAATNSQLESFGRYFCFCASVPKSSSGSVPIPACAPCQPPNDPSPRELFGDDHDGSQIHFHAAVALRRENGFEPQRRRFAQQRDREVEIAVLHCLDVRRDFLIEKLARGARDGVMLFGEIFRREDVARRLIFNQERAAGGFAH